MILFIPVKKSFETFFLLFCFHVNFRGNKIIGCLLDFEKTENFFECLWFFLRGKRFYDSKHFSTQNVCAFLPASLLAFGPRSPLSKGLRPNPTSPRDWRLGLRAVTKAQKNTLRFVFLLREICIL